MTGFETTSYTTVGRVGYPFNHPGCMDKKRVFPELGSLPTGPLQDCGPHSCYQTTNSQVSETDCNFLAFQTSQPARSTTGAHYHRGKTLPIIVGLQTDERVQPFVSETGNKIYDCRL